VYGGSATLPLRFSDVDASKAGGQLIDYHVPSAYRALGMARAGELAVARGVISEQQAHRWSEDLEKADDRLIFFASVTGFRASGRLATASSL